MGVCVWEKLKDVWSRKTNDYILQHEKICPGRTMEATTLLKVIRYNWLARNQQVFLNVPHGHKFRKQKFPPVQGFLLKSGLGHGRSFFVHTMSSTYPSTQYLLQHGKPFSKFQNFYLQVNNLFEITLNMQCFFEDFRKIPCHPFASSCFQYSNQKLSNHHLCLSEQLYLIHETFVHGLRQNSDLESVLELIFLAAQNLHNLYLSTWRQLLAQSHEPLSDMLAQLLTSEEKEVDLIYNFLIMGGNLLWVSIKGFCDNIFKATTTSPKKMKINNYRDSYTLIVIEMMFRLLNCTKNLPVLFFFWTEKNVLTEKVFHNLTLDTLLEDFEEESDTTCWNDATLYWSQIHERLILLDFSGTINLEKQKTIVLWFFEKSFPKDSLKSFETLISRILEWTPSTTIPQLIDFLQTLVYQATLKTGTSKEKNTETRITEKDILECVKQRFVVPVHQTHFLDFRTKRSLTSMTTRPSQWVTIAHERNKENQETLDPFFNSFVACQRRGWPYTFFLVEGETGSGKSHFATCLAETCNVGLLSIYPSDVMKPLLGDSEKSIVTIFKVAYDNSPCIVCFEDVDTWCENNEANESYQTSSVSVRLTTELLRQLDELRFDYIFQNMPCPILILLLIKTTENQKRNLHSNFYQPYRQGKRIVLPLLRYWKTQDFVAIFLNQLDEPFILCESLEEENKSRFDRLEKIFTNNIHHLKSPAIVKKLINTINQQKLRRFTKLEATCCRNDIKNKTNLTRHSVCLCDIMDAFAHIA